MEIQQRAQAWLDSPIVDENTKAEIREMTQEALSDAFYTDLEFGTGGLRGVMGAGTNRMNKYVVGMATQGLSNYLKLQFPDQEIKVAIAHDSRNNSRFYAETAAAVFSANGIRVHLFHELRPTPQLSFAIRELGCQSGVVITASHNPKEYNGYKAYWSDGAQLITPHDKGVIAEVRKITSFEQVKWKGEDGLIESIGEEMDIRYLNALIGQCRSNLINPQIKIVYTPIHGTGITLIPRALGMTGFRNVRVVDTQSEANGNFPTVIYPNPEEEEAMKMALETARAWDADIVMATDPDTDRVGIGVKNHKGEFQLLNGNQTGALLFYYLLKMDSGRLTGKEFTAKTIVTSELIGDISRSFGVKYYDTLTGFKYIADLIRNKEGEEKFILGCEESYGYMIGDYVRDKDGVVACALLAEICGWASFHDKTLFDLLLEIYQTHGLYKESLKSITKKGQSGAEDIKEMMRQFRAQPPKELAGSVVTQMIDYQEGYQTNLVSGEKSPIHFPKSNVLQFLTQDGSKVSLRPSGTEPKIKFYFSAKMDLPGKEAFEKIDEVLGKKLDSLQHDLLDSLL